MITQKQYNATYKDTNIDKQICELFTMTNIERQKDKFLIFWIESFTELVIAGLDLEGTGTVKWNLNKGH